MYPKSFRLVIDIDSAINTSPYLQVCPLIYHSHFVFISFPLSSEQARLGFASRDAGTTTGSMIIDGRHDRGQQGPDETWLSLVVQHVSNQLWTKNDCMKLTAGRSWRLREPMDIKRFELV